jgi:tetratricopeptide (TPR) repeat protein
VARLCAGGLLGAVLLVAAPSLTALGQATISPAQSASPGSSDFETKARALGTKQAWSELAQLAAQWLKAQPNAPEAWLALGLADTGLRNFDRAAQALEKATALGPTLYWPWADLGAVYFSLSRFQQSIQCYQRLLVLKPGDSRALMGMAFSYLGMGNRQQALVFFQDAARAAPGDQQAWYFVGLQELMLAQPQPAIAALTKATELGPNDVKSWFLLGQAYYRTGQMESVKRVFSHIAPLNFAYAASYSDKYLNPTLDALRWPGIDASLSPVAKAESLETLAAEGQGPALQALTDAAQRGEPAAAYALGEYDRDARHDPAEATQRFNVATSWGNVDAATALGRLYLDGQGVAKNEATAYSWFLRAAWAGDADAAALVAAAFADGLGGFPRDANKAEFWRARANAGPPPIDELDDAPLSDFDKGIGAASHEIVTSMLYAGTVAGDSSGHTGQLLTTMSENGFARLDDRELLIAMRLRASLAMKGGDAACAALWTGDTSPALLEAVGRLPPAEQKEWAELIAAVARAARSDQVPVAASEAEIVGAMNNLFRIMSPPDRAAVNTVPDTPTAQCRAAQALYRALQKLDRPDALIILRASVFG